VVTKVSQATFDEGSNAMKLSIRASDIWSATLSGCPSETDSEVKRYAISTINFFLKFYGNIRPKHKSLLAKLSTKIRKNAQNFVSSLSAYSQGSELYYKTTTNIFK
jgi:hypothetical protein